MIDSIAGRLHSKQPTEIVIDINGFRLKLNISVPTYDRLPNKDETVDLLTYLHVREDILNLYGFSSVEERKLFLLLIAITGIGPRSAMTILSGTNPREFKNRIIAGDVKSLTRVPGIGPKTAKRIILELKEKFVVFQEDDNLDFLSTETTPLHNDAILALMSLGYRRSQSQRVLKELEKDGQLSGGLETIIKKALSKM